LLAPYRALDLTDESGFLCGKILADLGADVLKVEPPGGDAARAIGPFPSDQPDAATGLYWVSYNTNKRGISVRGVENSCYSSPLSGLATGEHSGRIARIDWFSGPSKNYKSHG